mgnify:CR=1 FL=1
MGNNKPVTKQRGPGTTPELRELNLISLAFDLVEQRLKNGTATSQETTHFLKLGSTTHQVEKDILELNKKLTEAKTEQIKSQSTTEKLVQGALEAMRIYAGYQTSDSDYDDTQPY